MLLLRHRPGDVFPIRQVATIKKQRYRKTIVTNEKDGSGHVSD